MPIRRRFANRSTVLSTSAQSVAAEQHEPSPLVHDPWAQRLLPLSGRIAAGMTRWSPARQTLIAATDKKLRGGWASFLCRKRYIDD